MGDDRPTLSDETDPMQSVVRALWFAARAHREQKRKGSGEPYVNHLIEVVELLTRVAEVRDRELLSAAVLHDVLEDTEVTAEEIEAEFGPRVRQVVEALTDDKQLPKEVRKELQVEHMRDASACVRLVKLADHTSNVASLPASWPYERRVEFLDWSERVAALCADTSEPLDREYRARVALARAVLEREASGR